MKKINEILKKTIALFMICMIFISYSYPGIVLGDTSEWSRDFDANIGGDYKDYKYDDIPINDPTLNQLRGDIAYEGVIMQAYVINQLIISGDLKYEETGIMVPGPNGGWKKTGTILSSTVQGKTVEDLIKEKIEQLNKGSVVVRDYAISKLDTNLELLKAKITLASPSYISWENAHALAKEKEKEINPDDGKGGESAKDVIDGIEEDNKQQQEGEEEEEDTADLGGILLSPVFYLLNFIADAIIGNLERIMTGDNLGLGAGAKVLIDKDKYDPTGYNTANTTTYAVSLESFLPNFLSDDSYQYPNIRYTPEAIFSGEIELLSIDFISGKTSAGDTITDDSWLNIRNVISQWYQVLRMVAIIGLLSVLIYTGIKIILSANAKDKAKYKEWIMDWLMAVAILFSMHIIMAFIIAVTGEFSTLIKNAFQGINVQLDDGNSFVTNLMGLVRFMIQSENFYIKVAYEVMYIALIVYTIKFTLIYLKRVLNMAFLTLIAPIVALTYPIDKINDGRAQGFDMWLKEYMFNALLQPMHLILYYVLVGSAVSIAASNPIYGIVVLMFMTEAEKLLKKIFGFDKAGGGTVGGMAGAFAAGAIASNIKNIAKLAGGSGGNGGKGNSEKLGDGEAKPTKGLDMDTFSDGNALPEGNAEEEQHSSADEAIDDYRNDGDGPNADAAEYNEGYDSRNNQTYNENGYLEAQEPAQEQENQQEEQQGEQPSAPQDSKKPVRDMSRRIGKGALAVGKKLAKPVWDFEHGAAYNGKRLARKLGRGALGVGLGIGAAAVQAGISITDGKYNPAEGLATFAAGYAGGGGISKGIGGLVDAYKEGSVAGDKAAIMERAQKSWAEREDVKAFNKANYKPEEIKEITRKQSEHLLPYGFNLSEMKSVTKYAEQLRKNNSSLTEEAAYKQAANTLKFKQSLEKQHQNNVAYDESKRKEYIATMVKGKSGEERAKMERAYQNAFSSLVAFNDANK